MINPCDCPEARLLREWLTDPWSLPDPDLWPVAMLLSEQLAVNRLRAMSHDLCAAQDWRKVASALSYAELDRRRSKYPSAPRTPAEIREQARQSWARWQREAVT